MRCRKVQLGDHASGPARVFFWGGDLHESPIQFGFPLFALNFRVIRVFRAFRGKKIGLEFLRLMRLFAAKYFRVLLFPKTGLDWSLAAVSLRLCTFVVRPA